MKKVTLISHNTDDTTALGEKFGRHAAPGWVIGLIGDLGAGKTQFVKGLARGLGINRRVQSPTFTLINEYHGGRLPLYHIDLYRLDSIEAVIGAGLDAYMQTKGVTVVEWAERCADLLPEHSRHVIFEHYNSEERKIIYDSLSD
ncbi:MAG: tRNA (adenosine(37)-N6)-threonylcarbamoyltransferase complex ATPase subunit type 1 TsaE [Verrucomicrobia bacterium]|nr:tRNA (adenosine(37)-N6)-threonylcarbamoyltransferase complex ATPase subunit type 1 TsaE [Verrucomicrobiota bacterium]